MKVSSAQYSAVCGQQTPLMGSTLRGAAVPLSPSHPNRLACSRPQLPCSQQRDRACELACSATPAAIAAVPGCAHAPRAVATLLLSRRVRCCSSSKAESSSGGSPDAESSSMPSPLTTSELSIPPSSSSAAQHEAAHTAGGPAAGVDADADAAEEHAADEDEYEDESEDYIIVDSDEEDEDGFVSATEADAKIEELLRDNTFNAAVLELAASMAAVGLQGTAALGLGWLLTQRSLLDSFRWSVSDVETGVLWALPCITLGLLITALPLPSHKQLMDRAALAAAGAAAAAPAAAAGGSAAGGDVGEEVDRSKLSLQAFNDARRMATNASLVSSIPVRVTIGGEDESEEQQLLTPYSATTATQALRYMQEYVAEPFSTKTYSAKTWGVRLVGGLLRRLSTELFWRGLVAAGLAGWLYSSWESAGTSQDSPLFYARLFGLLTPTASLALISLVLAATRLPADLARAQPTATYARLASMEVEVVGRLTEDDWLVLVIPADVAAAAAADPSKQQQQQQGKAGSKPFKPDSESFGQDVQEALADKVMAFGRIKAAQAERRRSGAAASSSSSGSSGSSSSKASGPQQEQQPKLSKQEMEQQLDKLLAGVQDWKRKYNISSSSGSPSTAPGFELTPREQEAAELAAGFLELVKASAAAKAAAAVATKSKYIAKSAGLPSSKLGSGLESVLRPLNDNPQRRLFLLHVGTADDGGSSSRGGQADSSSDEEDSSDEEEDEEPSRPGSVQAVLRAKARTAAEGARQDEVSRLAPRGSASSSSQAAGGAADKQQQPDKQGGSASKGGSSSGGNDSDSDSDGESPDEEEGMTFAELEALLKQQMRQLQSREGQNTDLALYLKASKGAYRVAATIPTAQDRIAGSLLLSYALLEQLAVAGAFVASGGNLAASFSAAAALQVAVVTLQQVVGERERRRVREAIGSGWALQLQMLGL